MILFHVAALDFDEPEVRLRAWLPTCLLRRAGVSAKLVERAVSDDLIKAAHCVVLAGRPSDHGLAVARQARQAGVPVILDVGSGDGAAAAMADTDRAAAFVELARYASVITAGNAIAARRIGQQTGAAEILVVPDPVETDEDLIDGLFRHPGSAGRLIATRIAARTRDAVLGLRRHWQGGAGARAGRKTIVWFGGSDRPNDEGGIAELLLAASELGELAEEVPLRIEVVGQIRLGARRLLKHVSAPITFHRYTPSRALARLRKADLCLLPGFSSARAALATASGIPVISPAITGPWLPAMRAALTDWPRWLAEQSQTAASLVRAHAAPAVVTAWRQAAERAQGRAAIRSGPPAGNGEVVPTQRLRVLLLLQQFQDIDLIVPIAEAASACADLDVRVAVLSKIASSAARRLRTAHNNGGRIEFWHGPDLLKQRIEPACFAADVAVTASEGSNFGARFARAFVIAGRAAGARALMLQHGLDNGGLTYGPMLRAAEFQSDLILTWGKAERLTAAACAETRARVVPVGCPKRTFDRSDFSDFPYADRPFIAIFENLHWRRYRDDFRMRFVRDVIATAGASPDLAFVLKPHMGGRWFTREGHSAGALPANLVIADPTTPQWRRFTADAFLAHASAVITTPSTIALDAARYRVPVALATYGIAAENYALLPRLERSEDWLDFVRQVRCGAYDQQKLTQFLADSTIGGDAIARILTVVRMAGARRSHMEILSVDKLAAS